MDEDNVRKNLDASQTQASTNILSYRNRKSKRKLKHTNTTSYSIIKYFEMINQTSVFDIKKVVDFREKKGCSMLVK